MHTAALWLLCTVIVFQAAASTTNYATEHRERQQTITNATLSETNTSRFLRAKASNVRKSKQKKFMTTTEATDDAQMWMQQYEIPNTASNEQKITRIDRRQRQRISTRQNANNNATAATIRQHTIKEQSYKRITPKKVSTPKSATTTTTTKITTTTASTTLSPNLATIPFGGGALGNFTFNLFSADFWRFLYPGNTAATTTFATPINSNKKPPKKFQPTIAATAVKITSSTKKPIADGPYRISLPSLSFPISYKSSKNHNSNNNNDYKNDVKEQEKRAALTAGLRARFYCPRENEVRFQLFPKICKTDQDCTVWNREELCCDIFGANSCVNGVPKPLEESVHAPILGVIPRKCPTRPLAELWWDVKECETDMDCWPRVCCPDGRKRYCRTSQPDLGTAPTPVKRSFDYLSEYLECTAPPPPIFDLHPKVCTSTLDCFPNVCCQEAGLRHCRPPKKSVLAWMANFLNLGFVKRLTQNIVIK